MFEVKWNAASTVKKALERYTRANVDRAVKGGVQRVKDDLRDYYDIKDVEEPNKFFRSGETDRRVHLWHQIKDSIQGPEVRYRCVRLSISHVAFQQKLHGGPIYPVRAKMLTIPIHGDAYARSAAEVESMFGRLFVIRMKDGRLFLAGKPNKRLTFYFRLSDGVNQEKWPGTLPGMRFAKESFRNGFRYTLNHSN